MAKGDIKMKKLIVGFIIAFFIIFITGSVYYWQYTKSPKYSLLQAKNAFEQHDLDNFKRYVDVEGIANSLIDQLIELVTDKGQSTKDQGVQSIESLYSGVVTLLKPQLSKLATQQIVKLVETGRLEKSQQETKPKEPNFLLLNILNIWNKIGDKNSPFQGIKYIKKEGKIVYVGLIFYYKQYNTELILELKMRDKGDYWQVAEFSNLTNYIKKLDELETKRINKLNAPIIDEMKKTLIIEKIEKRTKIDEFDINKKVLIKVKVRNNGEKEIDQYKILLIFNSLNGKELKRINIIDNDNIGPKDVGGGFWGIDVNPFASGDNVLFNTPQSKLDIKAEIQYIKFTDGSVLELHKKWRIIPEL